MKRVGFAALCGLLLGLVLLGVGGHKGKLPEVLQGPYDTLVGRIAPATPKEGDKASSKSSTKAALQKETLPKKVKLPGDDFFPLALIQTKENTHLVYLEKGKPKLATTSGWVRWSAASGLARIMLNKVPVQTLGPGGKKIETRASSSVDTVSRFDYETASQDHIFPAQVSGLSLEQEDLENLELASSFYRRVDRTVLGFVGDTIVLEKKEAIYMGGAHAVHEMDVERVGLSTGKKESERFDLKASKKAFDALRKRANRPPCSSVHKQSVALRGPMGQTIPVALAVGELEVCSSRSQLHWEESGAKINVEGWPEGFHWSKGKLSVLEEEAQLLVQDLLRLRGVPSLLVFSSPKWVPGFSKGGEQALLWMNLEKGLPTFELGTVGPVLGVSALDPSLLGARESLRLAQVFGLQ